jgi:hypothetical protein
MKQRNQNNFQNKTRQNKTKMAKRRIKDCQEECNQIIIKPKNSPQNHI